MTDLVVSSYVFYQNFLVSSFHTKSAGKEFVNKRCEICSSVLHLRLRPDRYPRYNLGLRRKLSMNTSTAATISFQCASIIEIFRASCNLRIYSGSWSFHFSFTAPTSTPHISARFTVAFAFPTTGTSIIFPSRVQAPRPIRLAYFLQVFRRSV